jgi:NAD(P)-dependent dehydrogenase (short-subunit alcohol dehydrogenase family)
VGDVSVHVQQLFDLTGKVALVTGGSRGLGLQMAQALGEAGARVVITARKELELAEAVAQLHREGIDATAVRCDMADLALLPDLVAGIVASHGQIDVLVNNAGATWGAPTESYPLQAWRKVTETNLTGLFFLTQAVGNQMIARGQGGRIINMASVAGLKGAEPEVLSAIAYSASKGALIALTRDLAVKWARHAITVNAIAPGFFPTKMSQGVIAQNEAALLSHIPLGRFGGEHDLKGAVLLFASQAGAYITGQILAVDGGETA